MQAEALHGREMVQSSAAKAFADSTELGLYLHESLCTLSKRGLHGTMNKGELNLQCKLIRVDTSAKQSRARAC